MESKESAGKSLSRHCARQTHTSIEKLVEQGWELSGGLSTLKVGEFTRLKGRESKRKTFEKGSDLVEVSSPSGTRGAVIVERNFCARLS
ncbi:hypothetical protein TWF718_004703 [Orbilia javanica]|uniref:Uncharacterized protein n=1 Tax=Orbilia javanica TaxID=47235 RepID=A0AAN8MVW6_9PEZI